MSDKHGGGLRLVSPAAGRREKGRVANGWKLGNHRCGPIVVGILFVGLSSCHVPMTGRSGPTTMLGACAEVVGVTSAAIMDIENEPIHHRYCAGQCDEQEADHVGYHHP
jgi:hypothetical protein